jgi:hypothetical protein
MIGRCAFYWLALPVGGRFGGFRYDEFESLALSFDLVSLARRPVLLRS